METVAYVEELGRNGDVVRRHVLQKLPARIGRGYDVDVMVDDPHVAAQHLEVRVAEDGALEAVDLGSLNGTLRLDNAERISTTRIHGDDVFRIGQSQLRIRLPGQLVPAELPLPQRTWDRQPRVFAGAAAVVVGLLAWGGFVTTFDTDPSNILSAPVPVVIWLLGWAGIWSLVCRTMHGRWNYLAHGIVAILGCAAFLLVDTLTGYIDFSFDLGGFDLARSLCLAAVFAGMLYRHLRLTVRLSPRILGALAAVAVAVPFAGAQGYEAVRSANKPGLQTYDKGIKPSIFLFTQGISPDQFVGSAEKMKTKADKDAGSMVR
jgi:hypothetical protein